MTETLEILRPLREGKVSDEDTARIFDVAVKRAGLGGKQRPELSTKGFRRPTAGQLELELVEYGK